MSTMSMAPTAYASPPEDVRHLSQAEHLLVFGFRAVALGYGDCPVVERTFLSLLGLEGGGALADLYVFARLVGGTARRRLRLHAPGCWRLGEDELMLIEAVALAQATLAGAEEVALSDALQRLTHARPGEALMMAAQRLAAALTLGGADLKAGGAAWSPRPATVH